MHKHPPIAHTAPRKPSPTSPWYLGLYRALTHIATPVWHKILRTRQAKGKETQDSIEQKLACNMPPRPAGTLIWGHAVGVGESLALLGLFQTLAQNPTNSETDSETDSETQIHYLITSSARTSGEVLNKHNTHPHIHHQFAPIDTPHIVERFLNHWQPDIALWCELDLWPNLIRQTAARNIPTALINVRMTPASANKKRKAQQLYRWIFGQFDQIYTQNLDTTHIMQQFGVSADKLHIIGNIKALAPALPVEPEQLRTWRTQLGTRPVYLLASSHPGEETLISAALTDNPHIQNSTPPNPIPLLIIAPRDAKRGAELQQQLSQQHPHAHIQRRSESTQPAHPDTHIYIADSMGEMGLWYRLSTLTLVGGSWTDIGGHNPYEPLALGKPILHGPYTHNFQEDYQTLDTQGRSTLVSTPDAITASIAAHNATGTPPPSHTANAQPQPTPKQPQTEHPLIQQLRTWSANPAHQPKLMLKYPTHARQPEHPAASAPNKPHADNQHPT